MYPERHSPVENLRVHPRGLLQMYESLDQRSYNPRKQDFWHAIVTDVRMATDTDTPFVFSLAGGLSNSHSEIAHATGRSSEPSHRMLLQGDTHPRNVFLRLSGERDQNGQTRLTAEILPGGKPQDPAELVELGASLLQAGVQSGDTPPNGWDSFAVYINATSHLQQTWLLDTTDPHGAVSAALMS